ncbi:hypothetical protein Tco_0797111 [Tanacetum coccineum]
MAPRAVLMKTGLKYVNTARPVNTVRFVNTGRPFSTARIVDSGCLRHMTGNITHLLDFKDFDEGYVTFGGGAYGGRITGKNKPMIEGNGPKWMFDLDSLTQSMNYLPVVAGTFSNDFTGCSYFGDDAPRSVADAQIQDKDSHASEDTQVEDQEIELGNIPPSYAVPTTPHARIHKDHLRRSCGLVDVQSHRRTQKGFSKLLVIQHGRIMQEELLQFKLQKSGFLVDLPKGLTIGTKCVQPPVLKNPDHPDKSIRYHGCRLWYPKDSPWELVTYTDSDYAGATQDRKSTTGGCPFLGNRLISWQCKKQTVVATSTTKAKYVAAANCCGQIFLTKGFDAGRFQYFGLQVLNA